MNNLTLDGQSGSEADIQGAFNETTAFDAIAEVKVMMNTYNAEYDRQAGPTVNFATKSGTRDFHGTVYR